MSEQRARIESHIRAHPGVHFNGLVRRLDLAPGQVQYHLHRLRHDETIVAEELYGQTHYYDPRFGDWERRALGLARRETSRDILLHLIEHGETAASDIADELGLARSTLSWHRDRLVEQELVETRRDDRNRVTLVLRRPEATLRLLEAIRPSLPERFLDRFTRLVDALLAE